MVEWKSIGEITTIIRGNRVTKSDLIENGKYPVISGGVSPLGFINKYNREPNTITIAQYGSAGYIDMQKESFWANDVCYSVYPTDCVVNKYLYYALMNQQLYIYSLRTNAVPAHLPLKTLQEVQIPIPSKPEQERIVKILDTFTNSIANLKAQIDARRKQYEYYRDQLLDLEGKEGVEMKTLGEIGNVTKLAGFEFTEHVTYNENGKIIALRGLNVREGFLDLSQVKYIDGSNFSKLDRSKLFVNDMLFTYVGTIGNVALVDENDRFYLAPNVSRIRFNENIVKPKFALYYFLSNYFIRTQINKYLNSSSMKNLSMENIRKFQIPIPSKEEQSRIVGILDQFEASIANLEAQLKAREKQYEYYRNKLLTFD